MVKRMLLPAAIIVMAFTAPAAGQTVFVSNEKDNTLSVIDAQTLKVTKTIKVGKRPRGITLNADGSLLYICASDDNTVQVLDTATGKILHNLPSGEDPEQFALHPDGTHLFIANEDSNVVTVVDVPARKVAYQIDVGVEPEGMAVSPDGTWAVNTSETTNMVHWIDTDKRLLVDNTLVDSRPRHAEFDKSGKKLWVSAEIGGTVSDHRHGHPQGRAHDPVQYQGRVQGQDPAGRRPAERRRPLRLRGAGSRQPRGRGQCPDLRGREIPAGRPPGLAPGIHTGPEAAFHLQRGQQ